MYGRDYDDAYGSNSSATVQQEETMVIAVLGSTGTGKSSFIKLLSGNNNVHVGDGLDSMTSDIQPVPFHDPESGRNVIIVDTPGFDDSRENITDTDVLKIITDFLLLTFDKKRKLNGLIYLHRISEPRFGGQSGRNLKMFRKLCGTKAYENVVVVTTFWDNVSQKTGEDREEQMKTKYFKDLFEGGAEFMRHDRSIESARDILRHIATLMPTNVRIQEEIRLEGKTLEETAAGSVHREEVERVIAKHKKEMSELKDELDTIKKGNYALRQELEQERDKLKRELARWEVEKAELQSGLDEAQEAQGRLEADAARDRANYEDWRHDQERRWESRFNDQQSRYDQLRRRNDEEMQQLREDQRARKRKPIISIVDIALLATGHIGIGILAAKKLFEFL